MGHVRVNLYLYKCDIQSSFPLINYIKEFWKETRNHNKNLKIFDLYYLRVFFTQTNRTNLQYQNDSNKILRFRYPQNLYYVVYSGYLPITVFLTNNFTMTVSQLEYLFICIDLLNLITCQRIIFKWKFVLNVPKFITSLRIVYEFSGKSLYFD